MIDTILIALGLIVLVIVCLPPKYDPAIRLKDWMNDWDKEPPE